MQFFYMHYLKTIAGLFILSFAVGCDNASTAQQAIQKASLYQAGIRQAEADEAQSFNKLTFAKHKWGDLLVRYPLRLDCSTHVYNAVTWAERRDDHILLCYSLLENDPNEDAQILGACPQTLTLEYQFQGIAQENMPPFKIQQDCPEAGMQSERAMRFKY